MYWRARTAAVIMLAIGLAGSARAAVTWSGDILPNDPALWTSATEAYVGKSSPTASLTVDGGSDIVSGLTNIARYYIANADATVSGLGSTWTTGTLYVGNNGYGTLDIIAGGVVSSAAGDIGHVGSGPDRVSTVTVDGQGSRWANLGNLMVGYGGNSVLNIFDGGMVTVGGTLTIDYNQYGDDNFVRMTSGGMIALSDSEWMPGDDLADFLALVSGAGPIQYWDGAGWANITEATYGVDYTLVHAGSGDLADYTILTVPEPATLSLLIGGALAGLRRRRQ